MISRLKSFLWGNSFAPKINYPVYYFLKDNFWTRLPVVSRIIKYLCYHFPALRNKWCYLRVNERIVEIPLIVQTITKSCAQILDVGCDESLLTLHLASLGHKVTALDLNKYEFFHPNINFIKGDVCSVNLPERNYDYIIFLSALEHVGLGAYGEAGFGGGDRKALANVQQFLKPDGKILISVPFGQKAITATQRVYDQSSILTLFEGFQIEQEHYFLGFGQKQWQEVMADKLSGVSSDLFTQGMAFFCIKKPDSIQLK
jgi:SAM-dependent methyltransferase